MTIGAGGRLISDRERTATPLVRGAEYWRDKAGSYARDIEGAYHAHRLAMIRRLLEPAVVAGGVAIDVGCGDGVLTQLLAERGLAVTGFDVNEEMVRAADERLGSAGLPRASVSLGGVDVLARVDAGSVDIVLAANVLAYFEKHEEDVFYGEARRVLKPGGALVIVHSNELFDLFALNERTARFMSCHLCPDAAPDEIGALLIDPAPIGRALFPVRENPLSYRHKLAGLGFAEEAQEFANLHDRPPALMDPEGFVDIEARSYADTLDWPEAERWKLAFCCSMFGSRARRTP